MAEDPKVAQARREALLARERLLLSVHELQARVAPRRLANNALDTARERGTAVLETATVAARRRPAVAAAVGVGFLALLARRPLGRLFHRPKQDTLAGPARHALPRPSGDKA